MILIGRTLFGPLVLIALLTQPMLTTAQSLRQEQIMGPMTSPEATPLSSVEVRLLAPSTNSVTQGVNRSRINPLQNEADRGQRGTWGRLNVPIDPLIPSGLARGALAAPTPALLLSFDGTGNPSGCNTCTPPDTTGVVGPNHYIQMVNATKIAIYSKAGTLLAPAFNLSTLWASGNCKADAGDPVVLHDPIADRWLLSQFANPNHMCFAISKTADPTGAYWLYEFDVGEFPDYFKLGVWPDGYYMIANETTYTAYAFDRANMLNGAAATFQKFTGGTNLYLPSHLDGATQPVAGTPNYFYTFKDNAYHDVATDRIELRAFHVDWVTPANSTFALINAFDVAPFTYTVCGFFNLDCVKQGGTTQRVDAVSEWPSSRFQYRNFGASQSMVGTFVVGGGAGSVGAAIRWFELRNTGSGWTLYQEGTFDPVDGNDRFMPSIAMDGVGNIALGYSVSSATLKPGIRYTVHRTEDVLGTMQAEATMVAGGGSQIGSNRWGDYSTLSVDPADDRTFWYTNEYYAVNSASTWSTRIGAFIAIASPGAPTNISIIAGPGSATISFTAPATNGSAPITSYTATCTAASQTTRTATGSGSPLVVTALTAGVVYSCSVTAYNGTFTSTASASTLVTPTRSVDITPVLLLLLLD